MFEKQKIDTLCTDYQQQVTFRSFDPDKSISINVKEDQPEEGTPNFKACNITISDEML